MRRFLSGIIFASVVLVGAGCISSAPVVVDDSTRINLSVFSFTLPQDDWSIVSETSDSVVIDRVADSELNISVSEIMGSDYTDFSSHTPEVETDEVSVYRDGCGGGWCAFYNLEFDDGSQYTIFFTGNIPVEEDDMTAILTSLSK